MYPRNVHFHERDKKLHDLGLKKKTEYIILYMYACFLQKRLVDEFSGGN